jgi:outer membrane immunogenic protein
MAIAILFISAGGAAAQPLDLWRGFYVGGTAGVVWGSSDVDLSAEPGSGSPVIQPLDLTALNIAMDSQGANGSGFTGTVELGYNVLFGRLLLGIEADFGLMNIGHSYTASIDSPDMGFESVNHTVDHRVDADWVWSVRPRIGLANEAMLFYVTGGYAQTDATATLSYSNDGLSPRSVTVSEDAESGWEAGVGAAYALTPNLSVKGEWIYADFGDIDLTAEPEGGFVSVTSRTHVTADALRIGIDYKF